jgi:thiol-disulfide isomerase/thioredoxin
VEEHIIFMKSVMMKSARGRIVSMGLIVALLVAGGLILWKSPWHASIEAKRCAPGGDRFASFERTDPPRPLAAAFVDAEGAMRSVADYSGKGLVVNFWATWCGPCVREMPALDRLREQIAGDGIDVIALSEDRGGPEIVESFYRKHDIAGLAVLLDAKRRTLREAKVANLPTTLLIDRRGNEVIRVVGVAEWDAPEMAAFIRTCLGGGDAAG